MSIRVEKVNGLNNDFYCMCKKLEDFQYNLLPGLKEKGYTLTDNLQDVIALVLYYDNKPIGSVGLKKVSDEVCDIVRVFVDEKYRGNGYAKMLLTEIEKLAKSLGYKRANIVAWCKSKEAVSLYKKFDYICSEEKISEWFGGFKYVELYKTLQK